MILNTTQLKNIAKEIRRNPLWGMLLLSEYVATDHPLFKACVNRAEAQLQQLPSVPLPDAIIREILNGNFQLDPATISAELRLQAGAPMRSPYHFRARDIPLAVQLARRSSSVSETRLASAVTKLVARGKRTGNSSYSAGKPRRRRSFKIRS